MPHRPQGERLSVECPTDEPLVARRRVHGVPPPPGLPLPSGRPVDLDPAPRAPAPSVTWVPATTPPPLPADEGRAGDLLLWFGALTVVIGYVSGVVAFGPDPACLP
jgi:hypothetical protein